MRERAQDTSLHSLLSTLRIPLRIEGRGKEREGGKEGREKREKRGGGKEREKGNSLQPMWTVILELKSNQVKLTHFFTGLLLECRVVS